MPFLETMRLQGQTVDATIVVGDSSNDVKAAISAGLPVIGCRYGYGTEEELVLATFRVTSVQELLPLLQGMVTC